MNIVFIHKLLKLFCVAEARIAYELLACRRVLALDPSTTDEVRNGVRERADACKRQKALDHLRDDVCGEHI